MGVTGMNRTVGCPAGQSASRLAGRLSTERVCPPSWYVRQSHVRFIPSSHTVAGCGTCSDCHCLQMSADTPMTALRRATVPAVRTMN